MRTLRRPAGEAVIALPVQFDNTQPFEPQLDALGAGLPLSAEQLPTTPMLVNPPSLNFIAAQVLAELHGRMGYFPTRPPPEGRRRTACRRATR